MKALPVSSMINRRALASKALNASITARLQAGRDLISPVCIYGVAEAHDVRVTFTDINMEGMYQRGTPSRIYLSSKRSLVRRAYSCAHELAHHVLGHGSSIDDLRENQAVRPWDVPEEYLADTFASFILMPTIGLRQAFVSRGLKPETADPSDIYHVACHFSVGYGTLITHMLWGEQSIGHARAGVLRKYTPKSIRAQILGKLTPQPLIIADRAWAAPSIDAEVGHLLLLPIGAVAHGEAIAPIADLPQGRLFEARRTGISQLTVPGTSWAAFGRIARKEYVGRAEFRHLEEDDDD